MSNLRINYEDTELEKAAELEQVQARVKLNRDVLASTFDYSARMGTSDAVLAQRNAVTLRQFEQMKCDLIHRLGLRWVTQQELAIR